MDLKVAEQQFNKNTADIYQLKELAPCA